MATRDEYTHAIFEFMSINKIYSVSFAVAGEVGKLLSGEIEQTDTPVIDLAFAVGVPLPKHVEIYDYVFNAYVNHQQWGNCKVVATDERGCPIFATTKELVNILEVKDA
jgi:hypothetical protein